MHTLVQICHLSLRDYLHERLLSACAVLGLAAVLAPLLILFGVKFGVVETLTERLRDHFGIDEVSVINHDSYYKRHDELPYEERCKLNYDHPDSFDTPLMVAHLRELRAGHPVQVPVYDYTIHNRSNETVLVRPAPVIIVEGILIFDSPELCDLMDMKVFVDTDADVRILRRIVRDVKERGRTLDSVVTQYLTTVKPMHYLYVEPTRALADVVINSGMNPVAFEMMKHNIQKLLDEEA